MKGVFMKKRHSRYLEIVNQIGVDQDKNDKEITEVLTEYKDILEVENFLHKKFLGSGQPREFGNIGVVFENPWYAFINEAVVFINNKKEKSFGSYLRVLYKGDLNGESSIFCLPRLETGKYVLTVSYRTTVRSWVIEAPGTATRADEKHEEALERCIIEKLGRRIVSTKCLSEEGIISERGIMGASVPVYLVTVGEEQLQEPSDFNVKKVVEIDAEVLKRGFLDGYIIIDGRKCLCRDGYTAFAILMLSLSS